MLVKLNFANKTRNFIIVKRLRIRSPVNSIDKVIFNSAKASKISNRVRSLMNLHKTSIRPFLIRAFIPDASNLPAVFFNRLQIIRAKTASSNKPADQRRKLWSANEFCWKHEFVQSIHWRRKSADFFNSFNNADDEWRPMTTKAQSGSVLATNRKLAWAELVHWTNLDADDEMSRRPCLRCKKRSFRLD